jgi:hypothetical protein
MNWGKGIAIVIVMFMLYIISFVYRAFQKDADLVREDYYEHEINFDQNKIDKQNYNELEGKVTISKNEDGIYFQFPPEVKQDITGSISFYRPDTKKYDRKFELQLNEEKQQVLDYDNFREGSYEITVQWEENSKGYIFEDKIQF